MSKAIAVESLSNWVVVDCVEGHPVAGQPPSNYSLKNPELRAHDRSPTPALISEQHVRCRSEDGRLEIILDPVQLTPFCDYALEYELMRQSEDTAGHVRLDLLPKRQVDFHLAPSSDLLASQLLPRWSVESFKKDIPAHGFRFSRPSDARISIASIRLQSASSDISWRVRIALQFQDQDAVTSDVKLDVRTANVPFESSTNNPLSVQIEKAQVESIAQNSEDTTGGSWNFEVGLSRNVGQDPFDECTHPEGKVDACLALSVEYFNASKDWSCADKTEIQRTITIRTGDGPLMALEQDGYPQLREYIGPRLEQHPATAHIVTPRVAVDADGRLKSALKLRPLKGNPEWEIKLGERTYRGGADERSWPLIPPLLPGKRERREVKFTFRGQRRQAEYIVRVAPLSNFPRVSLIIDLGTSAIAAAVAESGVVARALPLGDRLAEFDNQHEEHHLHGSQNLIASHVGLGGPFREEHDAVAPEQRPLSAPWRPWKFPETMRGRPNGGYDHSAATDRLKHLERTYDVMLPFAAASNIAKYMGRILFGAKMLLRETRPRVELPDTLIWERANGVGQKVNSVYIESLLRDLLDELFDFYIERSDCLAMQLRQHHLTHAENIPEAVSALRLILTHPCGLTGHQRTRYRNAGNDLLRRWRYGPLRRLVEKVEHNSKWEQLLGVPAQSDGVSLIPEPLAAACYVLKDNQKWGQRSPPFDLLLADIGAGTTDVVLLQVAAHDGGPQWRVKSYHTIRLGGNAVDCVIARRVFDLLQGMELFCDAREWKTFEGQARLRNSELAAGILHAKRNVRNRSDYAIWLPAYASYRDHNLFTFPFGNRLSWNETYLESNVSVRRDRDGIMVNVPEAALGKSVNCLLDGLAAEILAVLPDRYALNRPAIVLTGRGSLFAPLKERIFNRARSIGFESIEVEWEASQMKAAVADGAAELIRLHPAEETDHRLVLPPPNLWWALGTDGEPNAIECGPIDIGSQPDRIKLTSRRIQQKRFRLFSVPAGYGSDAVKEASKRFFQPWKVGAREDLADPDIVEYFASNAQGASAYSINHLRTGVAAQDVITWTLREASPSFKPPIYVRPTIKFDGVDPVAGNDSFEIELDGPVVL